MHPRLVRTVSHPRSARPQPAAAQRFAPLLFGMAAIFAIVGTGVAQEAPAAAAPAPPPPSPCTTDAAPYRDFDFWIGSWEVFDPATGSKVGDNEIVRHGDGCLITESWQGLQGGAGFSMNFHDPVARAWRQVWQSPAVFIDYHGGLDADGAMQLEGRITYHRSGRSAPFRGRWTPQPDGTVLQEFHEFDAEANEWKTWFRGEYRPKHAALRAPSAR